MTTSKGDSMPRRKVEDPRQLTIWEVLAKSPEYVQTLAGLQRLASSKISDWRGISAVPAGSALDKALAVFKAKTDIPLEIPFITMLHCMSAQLLARNVVIKIHSDSINPDLWGIILASSGSSKSWTKNKIQQITNVDFNFPDCAGPAGFVDALQEFNHGFYVRDEMGKFIKAIENNPTMMEMKDLFLRLKDGDKIVRKTKKEIIQVEKPALTILGFAVLETFLKEISADSLLDGFSQRFSITIAREDPKRPAKNFPLYEITYDEIDEIRAKWDKATASILHKEYTITEEAKAAFFESFNSMFDDFPKLPMSFLRRIMFRAFPYSLIYHIFLNKKSAEIDAEDMAWAGRLAALQAFDAATLITESQLPEIFRIYERASEVVAKCKAEGREAKSRDIMRHVSGVKSAADARAILQAVKE
jgi:hypothetical protein